MSLFWIPTTHLQDLANQGNAVTHGNFLTIHLCGFIIRYSAVVAENAEVGTKVLEVGATDPDEGEGGRVIFRFPEGANGVRFFAGTITCEHFNTI